MKSKVAKTMSCLLFKNKKCFSTISSTFHQAYIKEMENLKRVG